MLAPFCSFGISILICRLRYLHPLQKRSKNISITRYLDQKCCQNTRGHLASTMHFQRLFRLAITLLSIFALSNATSSSLAIPTDLSCGSSITALLSAVTIFDDCQNAIDIALIISAYSANAFDFNQKWLDGDHLRTDPYVLDSVVSARLRRLGSKLHALESLQHLDAHAQCKTTPYTGALVAKTLRIWYKTHEIPLAHVREALSSVAVQLDRCAQSVTQVRSAMNMYTTTGPYIEFLVSALGSGP